MIIPRYSGTDNYRIMQSFEWTNFSKFKPEKYLSSILISTILFWILTILFKKFFIF